MFLYVYTNHFLYIYVSNIRNTNTKVSLFPSFPRSNANNVYSKRFVRSDIGINFLGALVEAISQRCLHSQPSRFIYLTFLFGGSTVSGR